MIVKRIESEWFQDYRLPSMLVAFPHCSFKCEKENEGCCCQNSALATAPNIDVSIDAIVETYMNDHITSAIIMGGLEPFDSWEDLYSLIKAFRERTNDTIVIYTGYYPNEVREYASKLRELNNIVVKWGRFVPYQNKHWDNILGVKLASDNQYAERISE